MIMQYIMNSRNTRLGWDFPRPPGSEHPRPPWAPIWETTAFGSGKRKEREKKLGHQGCATRSGGDKKNCGTCGAAEGFNNSTREMRIPNICLVLKLDNGKLISIAHEQTQNHPVPHSNIDMYRRFL